MLISAFKRVVLSVLLPTFLLGSSRQTSHAPFPSFALNVPSFPYGQQNNLPPRLQWNQNFGYCGEVGFICAGLYFGQYCSQYTMRALASPDTPQYDSDSQLLLGVNDRDAADAASLDYEVWYPTNQPIDDFLVWVKQHTLQGHPVLIGLFNNFYLLYGETDPTEGDRKYDHIVLVTGIGSNFNDDAYHGTDVIYYCDCGLYGIFNNPPFLFNSTFDALKKTRQQANAPSGPLYSLSDDQPKHYAIALLGVDDDDDVTLPITIQASSNRENPEIIDGADISPPPAGSNTPPPPSPLTLTITVSDLTPNTSYNLYLYDDFSNVPTQDFNALASQAKQKFVISSAGTTYTMSLNILSNEQVIFRAVPLDAP
jgi:hypothetical protein